MAGKSKIEWTEATWNPIRGCTRISPGCQHCYAERMAARFCGQSQDPRIVDTSAPFYGFAQMTKSGPRWTGKVELIPELLDIPLRRRKPTTYFVNSMSDLFHESLPDEHILQVFDVMRRAHWHKYQVLTKRSVRLRNLASQLPWEPHVWMGVSVENEDYVYRIDHLRSTPAHIKFLSLEPLLGPLPNLDLSGIDWVIVGGESGPGARPMHPDWVRSIRDQCAEVQVPFFFKQWGGVQKKSAGHLLDGREHREFPVGGAQ